MVHRLSAVVHIADMTLCLNVGMNREGRTMIEKLLNWKMKYPGHKTVSYLRLMFSRILDSRYVALYPH